jgi:DNA-binding HxlR family transcriptional regulator
MAAVVTIANTPTERRLAGEPTGCAVERALALVGAKWTLVVLHYLMDGPMRFSDLQRRIPTASPKMLTMRLRDLEQLGLLTRTVHPEPLRVEYRLTAQGRSLRPIIASLEKWGRRLRTARRAAS